MLKRVVVTGIGGITAFGREWAKIKSAFQRGQNAVRSMDWAQQYPELEAQLGAPITDYTPPAHWTRKQLRSMGRVSHLCVDAAERALTDAGLLGNEEIKDGRMVWLAARPPAAPKTSVMWASCLSAAPRRISAPTPMCA